MRFFNTAGPCEPDRHYMVPAAARLPEARSLFDKGGYFVVHAPRQTGKTTTLRALAKEITNEGRYAAVYFSCKVVEVGREEQVVQIQQAILRQIRAGAAMNLPRELWPPDPWPASTEFTLLTEGLGAWARSCPRPLVLFFDEIDTLVGPNLRNVLGQLHAGFPERPGNFPWSVVLCGLRDVRDYREAAGKDPNRFGSSSPFNIKLKSIRLGNFTRQEIAQLYAQHTVETGQPFLPEAVDRVMALTRGQPWLVNAMAYQIVAEMGIVPPTPISVAHVEEAKERLIQQRATHLDSLAAKLAEERIRRVIIPVLSGDVEDMDVFDDDLEYVHDLGLIVDTNPVEVANPIYREVIAWVLTAQFERRIALPPRSFVGADGRLETRRIFTEFVTFWREHGEVLLSKASYAEVAAQLVLMAYLQRVVNGGGLLDREYGAGRGCIDLVVRWPCTDAAGGRAWQREAVELKVWKKGRPDPLAQGLGQLEQYLDRLGLDSGTLVIFDRRPTAQPLPERTALIEDHTPKGYPVLVIRA